MLKHWSQLRRVVLLGILAMSLALAGPPTTANAVAAHPEDGPIPEQGEALASGTTSSPLVLSGIWTSAGAWESQAADVAGLLILGLSLVGAGRILARRRDASASSSLGSEPAAATEKRNVPPRPVIVVSRGERRAAR